MFRLPTHLVALLTLLAVAPNASAETPSPPPKAAPPIASDAIKGAAPAHDPYLSDTAVPDLVAILPPPPRGHSASEAADRVAYNATRSAEGTPRWSLAMADVANGAGAILDDFSCVLGRRIDPQRLPTLMNLLERARLDIAQANRGPKLHYRRLRPFLGNEAPICVARSAELADSFSYPSGHAAQGWAYAMIMASLLPEKATQFLVRGRIYGESRVVCGVHWLSDVSAARLGASAVVAALQGDAGFRADLEKARADLKRALATDGPQPDPAICTREEAAGRQPLL